jgi:hypothetical protein
MSKSDFLENRIQQHVFDATPYTAPATLYVALYTVTPSDAGGGTECAYTSYARVATTPGTDWAVTGNEAENANEIAFPTATGGSETVVAFGILDAATLGNLLYWGALSTSRLVENGITPHFPAGSLTITED